MKQDIWIVDPDDARRGEWRNASPLHHGQVAATVARAFGLDFGKQEPLAYPPIPLFPQAEQARDTGA